MAKINFSKWNENGKGVPEEQMSIGKDDYPEVASVKRILNEYNSNAVKRKAELELKLKAIDEEYDRKIAALRAETDAAIKESYRREREALANLRRP